MLLQCVLILAAIVSTIAGLPANVNDTLQPRVQSTALEWTAWGDSFASGIGAGDLVEWGECWRFTGAYSRQLNAIPAGGKLPGSPDARKLNHCACSGSTTAIALKTQFREVGVDPPITAPHWGSRPTVGQPRFGTLTIGGVDVQFPEILRSCIYDLGPIRPCEEQLSNTWQLLQAPELVTVIEQVINTAIRAGRKQYWGSKFKLCVTGYAAFFNEDTELCNNRTFSVWGRPSENALLLTGELRREFNSMVDALNDVIKQAVARQAPWGAFYIDWQDSGALTKHRYCEETVVEPDKNRVDTWFFHLSHICDNPNKWCDALCYALDHTVKSCEKLHLKYNSDPMSMARGRSGQLWDPLSVQSDDPDLHVAMLSQVGRIFHPTYEAHAHIRDTIERMLDLDSAQAFDTPPVIATTMLSRYATSVVSPASESPTPSAVPPPAPPPVPSATQTVPPAVVCTNYKGWYFDFEVLGSFTGPTIGPTGLGLLAQLRGCGPVTKWGFATDYNSTNYSWRATGRIPVTFKKGCVGRATYSAGGPIVDQQKCIADPGWNKEPPSSKGSDTSPAPVRRAVPSPGIATIAYDNDGMFIRAQSTTVGAISMDVAIDKSKAVAARARNAGLLSQVPAPAKSDISIPSSRSAQVATFTRAQHNLPTQSPPPRGVECKTYYHGVYSSFAIAGVSWDNTLLQDGEGLKSWIETCGALTRWNFDTNWSEPDEFDPKKLKPYTWRAKGQLPIGRARCLTRIIPNAGGPETFIHCSGLSLNSGGEPT